MARDATSASDLGYSTPSASAAPSPESTGDSQIAVELARRNKLPLVAGAGVLLALVLGLAFGLSRLGGEQESDIRSIAVLPFHASTNADDDAYLSEGLAEEVLNDLAMVPGLRVVSRGSSFRYKDPGVELSEVARELRVDGIVAGRLSRRAGAITVSAELVDPANDSQLWGDQFDGASGIQDVPGKIARAVVTRLGIDDAQAANVGAPTTEKASAYDLYLKGRYHWHRRTSEGVQRGLEFFEQAIEIDPTYALAWAGVADSYEVGGGDYLDIPQQEAWKRARAAAERALEIDPDLPEALTTLADNLTFASYEFERAEQLFQRALELNPNYSMANIWYSELLMVTGRVEEAVAASRRGYALDPLSPVAQINLGSMLTLAGEYEEARILLERSVREHPEVEFGWFQLANLEEESGNPEEGARVMNRFMRQTGDPDMAGFADLLEAALEEGGMKGRARKILELTEGMPDAGRFRISHSWISESSTGRWTNSSNCSRRVRPTFYGYGWCPDSRSFAPCRDTANSWSNTASRPRPSDPASPGTRTSGARNR